MSEADEEAPDGDGVEADGDDHQNAEAVSEMPEKSERKGSGREVPEMGEDGIFGHIVGRNGAKRRIGGALKSGETHVLLLGPPASGKSMFLEALEEHIPGSVYRDGKRFTATQIQSAFAEDPPLLLIDEIDELDDYGVFSNPLEHGRVTEDTYRETYDREIRTQVIAAANSVAPLPGNIESRFYIVEFTPYSKEEAVEVARRMLPDRIEWIETEEEAAKVAIAVQEERGTTDVREYRDVASMASSLDDALELAQGVTDADEGPPPDPITPEDVKVARKEVGREKVKEAALREHERATQEAQEEAGPDVEADPAEDIDSHLREEVVRELAEKEAKRTGGESADGD